MRNKYPGVLTVVALLSICLPVQKAHAQEVTVSYQSFYDELSPYGQWIYDGRYGNVWVPNAEPGFRPYGSDGHWVMTDRGNMWVSDAPWSWACYHYGRWTYSGYYGWVWVPGHEWAPAWVSWRSGGGYYGWAPMGPGQEYGATYDYPDNYWVFVSPTYLYHPAVYSYYERGDAVVYVRQTSYVRYEGNNGYYGPRRETIERETRQPVQVYRVSSAGGAGVSRVGTNEVSIYRPAVNRETFGTARPAAVIDTREHPINNRPEPVPVNNGARQPAFRQEHPMPQAPQQQRMQTSQPAQQERPSRQQFVPQQAAQQGMQGRQQTAQEPQQPMRQQAGQQPAPQRGQGQPQRMQPQGGPQRPQPRQAPQQQHKDDKHR